MVRLKHHSSGSGNPEAESPEKLCLHLPCVHFPLPAKEAECVSADRKREQPGEVAGHVPAD